MKVLVASENIVKISAVKEAFSLFFDNVEAEGIAVASGVSEQPINAETYEGARNRVKNLIAFAKANKIKAEMFVAIEGGIQTLEEKNYAFGVVCISDDNGRTATGLSPHFEVPDFVMEKLQSGEELGKVIDDLSNERDTKRKGGAIGFLTRGKYNRKDLYVNGTIMALVPFLNGELYFENRNE